MVRSGGYTLERCCASLTRLRNINSCPYFSKSYVLLLTGFTPERFRSILSSFTTAASDRVF